jgi:hypothetical protein
MAKKICTILGLVFILLGVAGFFAPTLLGTHLGPAHNVIHLLSGAIALYLGTKGSEDAARTFCRIFGAVFLLLGVLGFVLGTGGDKMWAVLPGTLELGTMDHAVHTLLGAVFLIGGFAGRK